MGTLIDLFISEASKLPQKPTWYRASARVMTWERSGAEVGSPCRASSSSMEQGAELFDGASTTGIGCSNAWREVTIGFGTRPPWRFTAQMLPSTQWP